MKKKALLLLAVASMATFIGCSAETAQQETVKQDTEQTAEAEVDAGKKAVLVVSFGTSYNETREKTIGAVEQKLAQAYPDYELKRAFTSQIIIDKLKERDGEEINNIEQAMEALVADGYGTVVVQPTHIMNGEEYDEILAATSAYEDKLAICYGKPLLSESEDYTQLIEAIAAETPQLADKNCAVVFVGHGTHHHANSTYAALDYRFKAMGYDNAFVGTVENYPDLEKIKTDLTLYSPEKVVLVPLMLVAGDHASNDIAGDEDDSWKTELKKEGYEVECVLKGLGEYSGIQQMYAEHCNDAMTAE